jgi:hypothetical protein
VFHRLDEIMPDVERLMAGHSTVGRWTLAQILNHLASSIQYSIGGFPGRTAPWIVRVTFGKAARWSMLKRGVIPEGAPLPRGFVPQSDLDARWKRRPCARRSRRLGGASRPCRIRSLGR